MSTATKPQKANPFMAPGAPAREPQKGLHNLMTAREVAELLGVSRQMVSRYTISGELRTVRLGPKSHRYVLADVIAFVASRRD